MTSSETGNLFFENLKPSDALKLTLLPSYFYFKAKPPIERKPVCLGTSLAVNHVVQKLGLMTVRKVEQFQQRSKSSSYVGDRYQESFFQA